jgi:hypothetical protein
MRVEGGHMIESSPLACDEIWRIGWGQNTRFTERLLARLTTIEGSSLSGTTFSRCVLRRPH